MKNAKAAMEFVGDVRNTVELRIENETHTLGSLLSEQLLEDRRCLFSAYRVNHPTDTHVSLRVSGDRSCSVRDLLLETLRRIETDTVSLAEQFADSERRLWQ